MSARESLSRRELLARAGTGATIGLGVAGGIRQAQAGPRSEGKKDSPNEKIVLGLIGCGGMGAFNMRTLMEKKGVEVAALCDVDESRIPHDAADVEKKYGRKPEIYKDF